MQNCGACKHFQRLKSLTGNSGLCQLLDGRTSEDRGHKCVQFKRVKFHKKELALIQEARAVRKSLDLNGL